MPDPHETDPTQKRLQEIANTRRLLEHFPEDGVEVIREGGCEGPVTFTREDYLAMTAGLPLPEAFAEQID